MLARLGTRLVLAGLLAAGCAGCSDKSRERARETDREPIGTLASFGPPPATPNGPLGRRLSSDVDAVLTGLEQSGTIDREAVRRIGASRDARAAWILSDLLRVEGRAATVSGLVQSFERLTGAELEGEERTVGSWNAVTNHLIAWELPAPPGYVDFKRRLFTLVEPGWAPFFEDRQADIDWRYVSWGGVLIDDRPLGDPNPCERGCIPALDDPEVTDAAGGSWYPDDALVFGVVVNGEARAYPKNIMEVHELVNDTLGGRRIGMPYCTLCASAQAYLTDDVRTRDLVLRTSGLLSRSNKVMYELRTKSVFDTFKGRALSGPLRGVTLRQVTVVTSTWGAWKAAHPKTTIVARDGGIGESYPLDPLQGRDDEGPIFPVGDVDPRLAVQEQVVGVVTPSGKAVAFPAAAARDALQAGKEVELAGVRLRLDGDGLRAVYEGEELVSHQAFWFAWSQFHPGTAVWTPLSG